MKNEANSKQQQTLLLALARQSIRAGVDSGSKTVPDLNDYEAALTQQRASFVTLHKQGELRGCIGTTEAWQPLVTSVADNAWKAAFEDPRFTPVTAEELPELQLHISILTPAVALEFSDEADLIARLRPGIDGLIICRGEHQATFLPTVWEAVPSAGEFLQHLKQKAGIVGHDSVEQAWVYQTEGFGEGGGE
ncbi:MAG: AmmeMemoRadiSam system protein A [Gammaproteobacteria bacterium]